MADELIKCRACNGRGYHRCECWPGDCICGQGDETCWECAGDGWVDEIWTDEDEAAFEEWDERRRQKIAEANEF